jgi:hypothetical protein
LQDLPNTASTRTKAGWFSAFDGIHTTGFFGLLAVSRQCLLLPVKPAVRRCHAQLNEKGKSESEIVNFSHIRFSNSRNVFVRRMYSRSGNAHTHSGKYFCAN